MTEEEQAEIGRQWGEILGMKRHRDEHGTPVSPSWETTWGWKTSLGLFRTICHMADEARGVDVEKLKAEQAEVVKALELCFDVIDYVTAENMAPFIGVDRVTDAWQAARAALAKPKGGTSEKTL